MFLARVLGMGSLDLSYINELAEVIEDDDLVNEVREKLVEMPDQMDANTIIFLIFDRINREVFSHIKQQIEHGTIDTSNELERSALLNHCQNRIDEFSPYLNCLDSHFNNELDQVDIRGNTMSQIMSKVIPLFLENARS